jgi:hypothetical protein
VEKLLSDPNSYTRVEGTLKDNKVFCSCGRNVGLISDAGVEFFCRHCHVNVTLDLRISKAEKLARVADHLAEIARAITAL